jgi:translation initiation factor IF-3
MQKNKKNARSAELRQIRMGLKISDHDLGVKKRKAEEFLDDGDKVKYVLVYRGRELAHKDIGFKLAEKIINSYEGAVTVDQQPQMAGKQLTFVVRSNQNAKDKNPQRD